MNQEPGNTIAAPAARSTNPVAAKQSKYSAPAQPSADGSGAPRRSPRKSAAQHTNASAKPNGFLTQYVSEFPARSLNVYLTPASVMNVKHERKRFLTQPAKWYVSAALAKFLTPPAAGRKSA